MYFVMEYLEGKSLEDLIENEGAVELHRALNIANQIALALDGRARGRHPPRPQARQHHAD